MDDVSCWKFTWIANRGNNLGATLCRIPPQVNFFEGLRDNGRIFVAVASFGVSVANLYALAEFSYIARRTHALLSREKVFHAQ